MLLNTIRVAFVVLLNSLVVAATRCPSFADASASELVSLQFAPEQRSVASIYESSHVGGGNSVVHLMIAGPLLSPFSLMSTAAAAQPQLSLGRVLLSDYSGLGLWEWPLELTDALTAVRTSAATASCQSLFRVSIPMSDLSTRLLAKENQDGSRELLGAVRVTLHSLADQSRSKSFALPFRVTLPTAGPAQVLAADRLAFLDALESAHASWRSTKMLLLVAAVAAAAVASVLRLKSFHALHAQSVKKETRFRKNGVELPLRVPVSIDRADSPAPTSFVVVVTPP